MPLAGCNEDFVPVVNKFDRSAQFHGKPGRAEVFGEHVYLLAESPTHFGFDHANFAFRYLESGGQISSQEERYLGAGPQTPICPLRGSYCATAACGSIGAWFTGWE